MAEDSKRRRTGNGHDDDQTREMWIPGGPRTSTGKKGASAKPEGAAAKCRASHSPRVPGHPLPGWGGPAAEDRQKGRRRAGRQAAKAGAQGRCRRSQGGIVPRGGEAGRRTGQTRCRPGCHRSRSKRRPSWPAPRPRRCWSTRRRASSSRCRGGVKKATDLLVGRTLYNRGLGMDKKTKPPLPYVGCRPGPGGWNRRASRRTLHRLRPGQHRGDLPRGAGEWRERASHLAGDGANYGGAQWGMAGYTDASADRWRDGALSPKRTTGSRTSTVAEGIPDYTRKSMPEHRVRWAAAKQLWTEVRRPAQRGEGPTAVSRATQQGVEADLRG